MPYELEEAAQIDGCTPAQAFRKVKADLFGALLSYYSVCLSYHGANLYFRRVSLNYRDVFSSYRDVFSSCYAPFFNYCGVISHSFGMKSHTS